MILEKRIQLFLLLLFILIRFTAPASLQAEGTPFITAVLTGIAVPAGIFFLRGFLLIRNIEFPRHSGYRYKGHDRFLYKLSACRYQDPFLPVARKTG